MAMLYPVELARVAGLLPRLLVQVLPLMNAVEQRTGKKVGVPRLGGFRTFDDQAGIVADRDSQGATYPAAPAGSSYHEAGAALDLNIVGGTDADYRAMAEEAERMGLVAGYRFSNRDPYHVQLPGSLVTLRAEYAEWQKKKGCSCSSRSSSPS